MIAAALNMLIKMTGRNVTIERPGEYSAVTIRWAASNYARNLAGPEEIVVPGREYVISIEDLTKVAYPAPLRGDRVEDPILGISAITEVREMIDFGGKIIGFRVRTS